MDESDDEDREEEDGEPAERRGKCAGGHVAAVREPSHDGNRAYADYVFTERRAEDVFGERPRTPTRLVDDLCKKRRRGVADRDAEECRLDRRPAEDTCADGVAEPDHHDRVHYRRGNRDAAHLFHVFRGERKPH